MFRLQRFHLGSFTPPSYGYLYSGTGKNLSMVVSTLPVTDVSISPSATGLSFGSISWTSGSSSTTVSFHVDATSVGLQSISYSLGGTDALGYNAPSSGNINVIARGLTNRSFSNCCSGSFTTPVFGYFYAGTNRN